jgi:hypothetical protein
MACRRWVAGANRKNSEIGVRRSANSPIYRVAAVVFAKKSVVTNQHMSGMSPNGSGIRSVSGLMILQAKITPLASVRAVNR